MRVLVIENYPKTTLGLVGAELERAGAVCEIVRTHADEALPATPEGFDALVMLGGAQDALDDENHPYLKHEAALARAFGDADKAVLGICLGAQILARGYGARNILGRPLEFGWHEVRTTDAGRADPVLAAIGEAAPLFHWHLDTFTLPPDAAHLATSAMTPVQAFRIGRAVYGIQFHFEAGTELVASWTRDFAGEIAGYAPDWFDRHPAEAARHGPPADAAGTALARAWIAQARAASSSSAGPARRRESQFVSEPSA
jgi:GMP synthase-like glutamine amidotransferase